MSTYFPSTRVESHEQGLLRLAALKQAVAGTEQPEPAPVAGADGAVMDGLPMCRQGASVWMHHDWHLLRGECKRCGRKMTRL